MKVEGRSLMDEVWLQPVDGVVWRKEDNLLRVVIVDEHCELANDHLLELGMTSVLKARTLVDDVFAINGHVCVTNVEHQTMDEVRVRLAIVPALGLGCMGMSSFYGKREPDEVGIALIHHAFNKGITFFDTADAYGPFTNEVLVGKALKSLPRKKVQIATKFGNIFTADSQVVVKGTCEYVREACEASLQRLDVDYIDLYYQHRVDTNVPIEETMGELKRLVEEGKIKYIGLSEASVDTIRRAHAVHPISAVQLEWSLWTRDAEDEIIPTCRDLGIGIVPYSPLGRGFFSGKAIFEKLVEGDSRLVRMPRFQGENLEKNKVLYERVSILGRKHKCSPGQLALAWLLHQGDDVVPIPGTTKTANFEENLLSLKVKLSKEELEEVSAAVPTHEVAGDRYNEALMKRSWMYANTPLNAPKGIMSYSSARMIMKHFSTQDLSWLL